MKRLSMTLCRSTDGWIARTTDGVPQLGMAAEMTEAVKACAQKWIDANRPGATMACITIRMGQTAVVEILDPVKGVQA